MSLELIKHPNHLLLIDTSDTSANENDWCLQEGRIYKVVLPNHYQRKIIAASPKLEDLPLLPELPKDRGFTINYHKDGDGVIRIYNKEGFVYCMYPYHLSEEAEKHLHQLNELPKQEEDVFQLIESLVDKETSASVESKTRRQYEKFAMLGYKASSKKWSDEEVENMVLAAAKYGFDYRDNSQHQGEVPRGNILQWLQWYKSLFPTLNPIGFVLSDKFSTFEENLKHGRYIFE